MYLAEVTRTEIFEDGSCGDTEVLEYEILYLPPATSSINRISASGNGIAVSIGQHRIK